MRTLFNFALTIFLLSACYHSTKPANTLPWENFGYMGMANKINNLAGAASINCGIRNYLSKDDPVNTQISPSDSKYCIKNAIETNTPFRYGSIRIPVDSFLFQALVLSSKGEFWLIQYDSMVDGSSSLHDIQRCKSVNIDYAKITYSGNECLVVSEEEWLSDIAK